MVTRSANLAPTDDEVTRMRALLTTAAVQPFRTEMRPPSRDLLDVVEVQIATGARISEALAMTWREVHFSADPGEPSTVRIRATLLEPRSPEVRWPTWQDATKGDEVRSITIPSRVVEMLRERRRVTHPIRLDGPVLRGREGPTIQAGDRGAEPGPAPLGVSLEPADATPAGARDERVRRRAHKPTHLPQDLHHQGRAPYGMEAAQAAGGHASAATTAAFYVASKGETVVDTASLFDTDISGNKKPS